MVIEGLLCSLRPPDPEPPRLVTLTAEQEAVIAAFLEQLSFGDDVVCHRDFALQVLEEWWLPNARATGLARAPDRSWLISPPASMKFVRAMNSSLTPSPSPAQGVCVIAARFHGN